METYLQHPGEVVGGFSSNKDLVFLGGMVACVATEIPKTWVFTGDRKTRNIVEYLQTMTGS